jgi:hypothetical protein
MLGVYRMGVVVDWHLGWRKGSVLSRLTGEITELSNILADAARNTRTALDGQYTDKLKTAAARAEELGKALGVKAVEKYKPALDEQAMNFGNACIVLHDGKVPLRQVGTGTRRLLTLALQNDVVKAGGAILIDEIEYALEPHRIHLLIKTLKKQEDKEKEGNVIITTHSPVVIRELTAIELSIIRKVKNEVRIFPLEATIQDIIRKVPEALLGKKIIVCEGKTEHGFCKQLDYWWWSIKNLTPFASLGIVPAECLKGGGNSESAKTAMVLSQLGYEVAFICDSDCKLNPTQEELQNQGVLVICWDGMVSIEQRIVTDLPWEGVKDIIRLAIQEKGKESIIDALKNRLSSSLPSLSQSFDSWIDDGNLRKAIGEVAKKNRWFKNVDLGEALCRIVTKYIDNVSETDLYKKIKLLRDWIDKDV